MATWTQRVLQTTNTLESVAEWSTTEEVVNLELVSNQESRGVSNQTVPDISYSVNQTPPVSAKASTLSTTLPAQQRQTDQNIQTVLDELNLDFGVSIPGVFLPVDVVVRDADGNRLPEVKWIMSAGVFPTAARVDENAEATMRLLGTTYTEFMAVAEDDVSGTEFLDYAWYTGSQEQEPIAPLSQDTAEILITPERVEIEESPVSDFTSLGGGGIG